MPFPLTDVRLVVQLDRQAEQELLGFIRRAGVPEPLHVLIETAEAHEPLVFDHQHQMGEPEQLQRLVQIARRLVGHMPAHGRHSQQLIHPLALGLSRRGRSQVRVAMRQQRGAVIGDAHGLQPVAFVRVGLLLQPAPGLLADAAESQAQHFAVAGHVMPLGGALRYAAAEGVPVPLVLLVGQVGRKSVQHHICGGIADGRLPFPRPPVHRAHADDAFLVLDHHRHAFEHEPEGGGLAFGQAAVQMAG